MNSNYNKKKKKMSYTNILNDSGLKKDVKEFLRRCTAECNLK